MQNKIKIKNTVKIYAGQLLDYMKQNIKKGPRTYGFEYEFLPSSVMTPDAMKHVYGFLEHTGFSHENEFFKAPSGLSVSFEPGGQIEYHSPPLLPQDEDRFFHLLNHIEKTNLKIERELGIKFIPTGYIQGRKNSPLCLLSKRYRNLHARVSKSGTRGLEMMKGTAAIHLHVSIQNIDEIAHLFTKVCEISLKNNFKMHPDRRDIWNNTDDSRCGLPQHGFSDSRTQAENMVNSAFKAVDIEENIPFEETENVNFNSLMYHMTTMFTDVRLNIKGPTVELRTLDSMKRQDFELRWKKFISFFERG